MTGEPRTDADPRRRLPAIPLWVALLLMVAALALAAVILTRVAEPLYGLVFSSGVPVPEGAAEVERGKPERGAAAPGRRLPALPVWGALLLMVAALALAAVILTRVAEPLYGLVVSSGVPVPEGAVEVERVKPERGAAYRIYRTSQSGREVAAFYEGEGGTCGCSAASPLHFEAPTA